MFWLSSWKVSSYGEGLLCVLVNSACNTGVPVCFAWIFGFCGCLTLSVWWRSLKFRMNSGWKVLCAKDVIHWRSLSSLQMSWQNSAGNPPTLGSTSRLTSSSVLFSVGKVYSHSSDLFSVGKVYSCRSDLFSVGKVHSRRSDLFSVGKVHSRRSDLFSVGKVHSRRSDLFSVGKVHSRRSDLFSVGKVHSRRSDLFSVGKVHSHRSDLFSVAKVHSHRSDLFSVGKVYSCSSDLFPVGEVTVIVKSIQTWEGKKRKKGEKRRRKHTRTQIQEGENHAICANYKKNGGIHMSGEDSKTSADCVCVCHLGNRLWLCVCVCVCVHACVCVHCCCCSVAGALCGGVLWPEPHQSAGADGDLQQTCRKNHRTWR